VKIHGLTILETRIPFRFTFRHALASRHEGHGVLVRVIDEDGNVGYGECVPRSYVTGETPESVIQTLREELAPPWIGTVVRSFDGLVGRLQDRLASLPRDQHAAHCALELALLDVGGRAFGCSAGSVLGPVRSPQLEYSGVVPADGMETSMRMLESIRAFGFRRVKIKVGADEADDDAVIRKARELLGDDCRIRIDANCAWDWETALRRLEHLEPFELESVEQPVPGDDIDGLARLTARSPIPVIVDESLASMDDARTLIEREACHHFNIRVSKCGGLINSGRIRDAAHEAGMRCQLGAQVGETVILSAAGNLFASRTEDLLFAEGSFGTILLSDDIGEQDLTLRPGARALALQRPGLGVEVDVDRLRPFVVSAVEMGDGSWDS